MTETLAHGHSYESTQQELSDEYQHDRDSMIFKDISVCVLWMKVASALKGLNQEPSDQGNDLILTHSWTYRHRPLCYLGNISLAKAIFKKYWEKNCCLETT